MINTTLPGIILDSESYATFKNAVMSANVTISCETSSNCGTQQYSCAELAESLPPLTFYIGKFYYTLPISAYTRSGFTSSRGCSFIVDEMLPSESNEQMNYTMVLGNSFLRQYTTVFNIKDKTIALATSKYADVDAEIKPIPPDNPDFPPQPPTPGPNGEEGLNEVTIIAIICGIFFVLVLIIAIIVWRCNRKS